MNPFSSSPSTHFLRKVICSFGMEQMWFLKYFGVSSMNLISWSSSLGGGNHLAFSLEKTSEQSEYCGGILFSSCHIFVFSAAMAHSEAKVVLFISAILVAVLALIVPSTNLSFHEILGSNSWNQGIPKIIQSFPRFVMQNKRVASCSWQERVRSACLQIFLDLFKVPSTFVTGQGLLSFFILIPSRIMVQMSMKLWEAPLSSRAFSSVICLAVSRENGAYIVGLELLDIWLACIMTV